MKTEVFYTPESALKKIEQLCESGKPYSCDVEFNYDVQLTCYVVSWLEF